MTWLGFLTRDFLITCLVVLTVRLHCYAIRSMICSTVKLCEVCISVCILLIALLTRPRWSMFKGRSLFRETYRCSIRSVHIRVHITSHPSFAHIHFLLETMFKACGQARYSPHKDGAVFFLASGKLHEEKVGFHTCSCFFLCT